jgi:hypothetical protein
MASLGSSENVLRLFMETKIIIPDSALLLQLKMHFLVHAETYMVLSIHNISNLINLFQLIQNNGLAFVLNRFKMGQNSRQVHFEFRVSVCVPRVLNSSIRAFHDLKLGCKSDKEVSVQIPL